MLYGEAHQALMATIRRIVDSEIEPFVDEWEEAGIFPAHELFPKLGRAGLLGITKPAAFGGQGLDYSYAVAAAEAFGHISAGGVSMAIAVQTDMATPALARFGSDALRRDYLAPAIAGEMVAAIGVSEPGSGSDVASIRTKAVRDGGDYVVTGTKMWITSALQADWICLLANTGRGRRTATSR